MLSFLHLSNEFAWSSEVIHRRNILFFFACACQFTTSKSFVGNTNISHFPFFRKFTFNPKEGIDNPVMVVMDDSGWCINLSNYQLSIRANCSGRLWQHLSISFCSESRSTPRPRLCVLRREEGESFGFHLRVEKGRQGHLIRNVVAGGVASRSGLQDGDRLLEVNNSYVDDVSHPEAR